MIDWIEFSDEYGTGFKSGNLIRYVTHTQKWHDKNPTLPEPSEIELLQQENAMLQMSVMELSTYAASQDERLQTQENAVMELSMLIAGGGM